MSVPHCVRERESDFERLVGQNLWRVESLVRSEILPSEKSILSLVVWETTRVFAGAVLEILLHTGGELAAQLFLIVVRKFAHVCSRHARTSGGTVDDRVRGRRRGGDILQ